MTRGSEHGEESGSESESGEEEEWEVIEVRKGEVVRGVQGAIGECRSEREKRAMGEGERERGRERERNVQRETRSWGAERSGTRTMARRRDAADVRTQRERAG